VAMIGAGFYGFEGLAKSKWVNSVPGMRLAAILIEM